jgi:1-acyl-sn-glycerol-3-phosphate acyltransferase
MLTFLVKNVKILNAPSVLRQTVLRLPSVRQSILVKKRPRFQNYFHSGYKLTTLATNNTITAATSTASATSTATTIINPRLKKYLWRACWVPYAALSLIPITFSSLATYRWILGDVPGFRGTAFYALTGWLCLPLSVPVFLGAPFVLALDPDQRTFMDWIQKFWGRLTMMPFFNTELEGEDHLINLGPSVYVSNHQSWLDIYVLFWIDALKLKVVAKKEIMMIPVIGWLMSVIGHIPFDRRTGGKALLLECGKMLDNGADVFFFPEGTRSKDGQLQRFKPGAFILAKNHQVPIVPITILNTGEMMPRGREFWGTPMLKYGTAKIIIHPPVMPLKEAINGKGEMKTVEELTKEVYNVIDSKIPK